MHNYVKDLEAIAALQQQQVNALKAFLPKVNSEKNSHRTPGEWGFSVDEDFHTIDGVARQMKSVLKQAEQALVSVNDLLDQATACVAAPENHPLSCLVTMRQPDEHLELEYDRRRVKNTARIEFLPYAKYSRDGRHLGNIVTALSPDGTPAYYFAPLKCVVQKLNGPFQDVTEAVAGARDAQPFDLDMGPYALHDKNGVVEPEEPVQPGDNGYDYWPKLVGALLPPIWTYPEGVEAPEIDPYRNTPSSLILYPPVMRTDAKS